MIRNRIARRALGAVLIAIGAVLMWAVASPVFGSVLFLAAVALEIVGIALEQRAGDGDRSKN